MSPSAYLLISLAVGSLLLLAGGVLWVVSNRIVPSSDPILAPHRTAIVGNLFTVVAAWICSGWQIIVALVLFSFFELRAQSPDLAAIALLISGLATIVIDVLLTIDWLRPAVVRDPDDEAPRRRRSYVRAYSAVLIPALIAMAVGSMWTMFFSDWGSSFESVVALLFGVASLVAGWCVVAFSTTSRTVPMVAYDSPEQNLQVVIRFVAIVLIILGAFCWSWLGIIPGGLWLLVIWSTLAARNRAAELTALWTLAIASRSQRPLGPELWHHMDRVTGPAQRRLKLLAALLGDGEPLDLALQRSRVLPRNGSMEIQAALDANQVSAALKSAAARETLRFSQGPVVAETFSISYFAVIIDAMFFIVGFLMYYIIPKFKKIFEDFGTELPEMTITLIRISDGFASCGAPLILMLAPASIFAVWCDMHARFYGWRSLFERFCGSWVPRLRVPDILRGLAWGVRGERPVAESFSAMTLGRADYRMREQLRRIAEQVRNGVSPWDALAELRWITATEAEALQRAEAIGNLPWVLDTLADAEERRWEYRLNRYVQYLRPLLIFLLGLTVAFIAIAFFLPLVKLVNDLS